MANEFDAGSYSVAIRKTIEDGETYYEARVAELPDLLVYSATAASAHEEMLDVIRVARQAAFEEGRAFPPPASTHPHAEFSGRVTVRVARSEHARLARCAEEESVSLNSLITTAVARMLGEREGQMRAVVAYKAEVRSIAKPQTTVGTFAHPISIFESSTLPTGA